MVACREACLHPMLNHLGSRSAVRAPALPGLQVLPETHQAACSHTIQSLSAHASAAIWLRPLGAGLLLGRSTSLSSGLQDKPLKTKVGSVGRLRSYRWTSWLAEPTANSWEVIGFHWTVQTLARTSISARLFCCCDDHTWNRSRLLTKRF